MKKYPWVQVNKQTNKQINKQTMGMVSNIYELPSSSKALTTLGSQLPLKNLWGPGKERLRLLLF